MSERETLLALLGYAALLREEPSSLPPLKLKAANADLLQLETRGWQWIAGCSEENVSDLIVALGEGMTKLLETMNTNPAHRPVGAKENKYVAKDAAVIEDIKRGKGKRRAILARYPIQKQYRTHERRINRKLAEIDAQTRDRIALQTK